MKKQTQIPFSRRAAVAVLASCSMALAAFSQDVGTPPPVSPVVPPAFAPPPPASAAANSAADAATAAAAQQDFSAAIRAQQAAGVSASLATGTPAGAPTASTPMPGSAEAVGTIGASSPENRDTVLSQVSSIVDRASESKADLRRSGDKLSSDARGRFDSSFNTLQQRENDLRQSVDEARSAGASNWNTARANLAARYEAYTGALAATQAASGVQIQTGASIAAGASDAIDSSGSSLAAVSFNRPPPDAAPFASAPIPSTLSPSMDTVTLPTFTAPEAPKSFSSMMTGPETADTVGEMDFENRDSQLSFLTGRIDAAARYFKIRYDDAAAAGDSAAQTGAAYAKLLGREKDLRESLENAGKSKLKNWIPVRTRLAADYQAYVTAIAEVESADPAAQNREMN